MGLPISNWGPIVTLALYRTVSNSYIDLLIENHKFFLPLFHVALSIEMTRQFRISGYALQILVAESSAKLTVKIS